MERYKGRMASRAGYMKAGTTLLGGVANMGLAGAFSGGSGGGGGGGYQDTSAMFDMIG